MKIRISSVIFLWFIFNVPAFAYEYNGYHSGSGYYRGNYEHRMMEFGMITI